MTDNDAARIETTISLFSRIFLGGIPPIITNDSSFLSFITVLAATEALAGFRYSTDCEKPGARFKMFVREYFPEPYGQHAARLWTFRCRMFHSFSPAGFSLIHHQSDVHFKTAKDTGNPILNAEDFYTALVLASQKYFSEVRTSADLRARMIARLDDRREGGPIAVGPMSLA